MAIIVFKDKDDKKPKKEYIDLSVEHRKHKKMHGSYKKAFIISGILNILLSLYVILFK